MADPIKKALVDGSKCIGCGLCVSTCPEVFEIQEDGKSKATHPTGAPAEKVQEAIDGCPVQAISWVG